MNLTELTTLKDSVGAEGQPESEQNILRRPTTLQIENTPEARYNEMTVSATGAFSYQLLISSRKPTVPQIRGRARSFHLRLLCLPKSHLRLAHLPYESLGRRKQLPLKIPTMENMSLSLNEASWPIKHPVVSPCLRSQVREV